VFSVLFTEKVLVQRREFLKMSSLTAAASAAPGYFANASAIEVEKPNIVLCIVDQLAYGLTRSSGYPFDTCPTLDGLQKRGVGFTRNYCTMPLCVPSRVSMLTGRWPEAHRVRMNLQSGDAFFDRDIYQVAKSRGYSTALLGKNDTYLKKSDVDVWHEYFHDGGPRDGSVQPAEAAYDRWLRDQHFNVVNEPTPFPLSAQLPYRIVRDAMEFIDETANQPFLLQVSIPAPHDPEQVPAPMEHVSTRIRSSSLRRAGKAAASGFSCSMGISHAAGRIARDGASVETIPIQLSWLHAHDR
jgi:arylsulfatase A-like enzyme